MGLVEGKVIIVTGASSGIGEKTAEVLAAEGAKVVLAARRKEKLEDVANRIIAAGGEAYTVSGDVSVREDCDRIAEETVKKYGRIDVLVNNAGIGDKQMAITRCSDEWWRQIIAVNQDSVFYMSRAALVYMEKQGEGSIVNISSIGGVFANAQTGNIVLMGINIAKGDFERVIHYVVPILAFALGILISEVIKATLKKNTHMHWRQIIVLAEIIILIICGFIPSGKGNTFVNVMVSFVCSLQVESFRVINGNTVATTMCTGNLRSGTELLFLGLSKKDKSIAIRSLTYYGINLFFVIGAIVGAVVTKYLDVKSVFIASALLIIPFIMMFKSSENVEYI